MALKLAGMRERVADQLDHVLVGQRIINMPTGPALLNQALGSQESQPMRDGRELLLLAGRELADAGLAADQHLQGAQPGFVAEGLEEADGSLERARVELDAGQRRVLGGTTGRVGLGHARVRRGIFGAWGRVVVRVAMRVSVASMIVRVALGGQVSDDDRPRASRPTSMGRELHLSRLRALKREVESRHTLVTPAYPSAWLDPPRKSRACSAGFASAK